MSQNINCPLCGKKGKTVTQVTIESLVKNDFIKGLQSTSGFKFCKERECKIAYYNSETNKKINKEDLTVSVGQKETGPKRLICYCFNHSAKDLEEDLIKNNESTIFNEIKEQCKAGKDKCEENNPQGNCCLGNVSAVINDKGKSVALSNSRTSLIQNPVKRNLSGWRSSLFTAPGILLALIKITCPACWPAYAGLLSSLGFGFLLEIKYLLPLTIIFLLLALGSLLFRAATRRGYGPFAMGLVSALIILIGKFHFHSDVSLYGGVALLVAASLWNAWPYKAKNCSACKGELNPKPY